MINAQNTALYEQSFEFFEGGQHNYQLSSGDFTIIEVLPVEFTTLLTSELVGDKSAQKGLDKLGIHDQQKRVAKFYSCNYSASDEFPDIDLNGKLGPREFVRCLERENCPAEGNLCKFPAGLSKREMQIARRIALGQMDAQICYELEISQNTLRNHKNNIERKIGATGKIAIGVWAVRMNLI